MKVETEADVGFKISNVKISVKIRPVSLEKIEILCSESNFVYKKKQNFICFKVLDEESDFVYTIFKKSNCLKKRESVDSSEDSNLQHCNVTKIKQQKEIELSLSRLLKFLEYPHEKLSYTIDNITAHGKLKYKINLRKLMLENSDTNIISYNPEKFPGLRLKRSKLTYMIFTSGSYTILGGKSEDQIKSDIPWISDNAPPLSTKRFLLPLELRARQP